MNINRVLTDLTETLINANTAIPLVVSTVVAIAAIIKGVTGSGPSGTELADMLEAKLRANASALDEDIARMREMIPG
jgi:hypothetical protein